MPKTPSEAVGVYYCDKTKTKLKQNRVRILELIQNNRSGFSLF